MKVQREYLEFDAIIGKDNARIGGLQMSQFSKTTAIPFKGGGDGSAAGDNEGIPPSVSLKPEDFYEADFRLLSKSMVAPDSWKCCDFTVGNVLKNAMMLFERKPVYTDHATYQVKNAIGLTKKIWWDNAYVLDDGSRVPAGVNGCLAIDITTAEGLKLARSIEMGAVFSVSVGIEFDWVASHEFEDRYGFYDNMGVIQKDGQMCRRIVKTIYNINECSLVHLGADGYAKLLDENGKIVNPDYGQISIHKALGLSKADFSENSPIAVNNYSISCGFDKSLLGLSKAVGDLSKIKKEGMDRNFQYFMERFGFTATQFADEAAFNAHMIALIKDNKSIIGLQKVADKAKELGLDLEAATKDTVVFGEALTNLNNSIAAEKLNVVNLTAERDAFKLKADKHDERITTLRADAVSKYKSLMLTKKQDADETIVTLLNESDETKVTSLLKSYGLSFAENLSGKCGKCGSKEINFRSSESEGENPDEIVDKGNGFYDMVREKNQAANKFLNK